MIDQSKSLVGIGAVTFLTDMTMRYTPASFDRQRFAPLVCLIWSIVLSILASLKEQSVDVWSAVARGFIVAMGASGVYSVGKNYRNVAKSSTTRNLG